MGKQIAVYKLLDEDNFAVDTQCFLLPISQETRTKIETMMEIHFRAFPLGGVIQFNEDVPS